MLRADLSKLFLAIEKKHTTPKYATGDFITIIIFITVPDHHLPAHKAQTSRDRNTNKHLRVPVIMLQEPGPLYLERK